MRVVDSDPAAVRLVDTHGEGTLVLIRSAGVVVAFAAMAGAAVAQLPGGAEHEAIGYSMSAPMDPVSRLQHGIDAGALKLTFDAQRGYLPSVLEALRIPVSSQALVFSKTSLQVEHIAPSTPRAVYFNDEVYVAWVQGGRMLEIAAVAPKLGTVFYTLPQESSVTPRFRRQVGTCLVCHDSSSITGGVPGLIVRSVFPDKYGYPISTVHDGPTTDGTPLQLRWGGWYVTGNVGDQQHMGNVMAPLPAHGMGNAAQYIANGFIKAAASVTSVADRFDTDRYLSPHSDLVALMVLTHQARIHNLITIASYETGKALHEEGAGATSHTDAAGYSHRTLRRVKAVAEPLVRAMLFMGEAPLTSPVAGTSAFAKEFSARGLRDNKGRSLWDLDLSRRLFRYPLSYLVYSEPFEALPGVTRRYVYTRLRDLLGGVDPGLSHVSKEVRRATLEIIAATKPDFTAAPNRSEVGTAFKPDTARSKAGSHVRRSY